MIQWFSSLDEFEQLTEQYYKTHSVYFDTLCALTAVSFVELQSILPFPPEPNPLPLAEPGPHDHWYGCVDHLPFLLTHYYSGNREEGKEIHIRTFTSPPDQGNYGWSPLMQLVVLPKPLMQRIHWVGWRDRKKQTKQPVRSLYCCGSAVGMHSPIELYQAETVNEAEALLDFLRSLQSEYTYYIDEPSAELGGGILAEEG
jgi:hypothetical protein